MSARYYKKKDQNPFWALRISLTWLKLWGWCFRQVDLCLWHFGYEEVDVLYTKNYILSQCSKQNQNGYFLFINKLWWMTSIVYGPFFLTVRIVVISFDFIFFIGLQMQVIHKLVTFDFFLTLKLIQIIRFIRNSKWWRVSVLFANNFFEYRWHREALGRFNDCIASASTSRLFYDHISSISSD